MRRAVVLGWTAALLVIFNALIASKERVVGAGREVLLELRPADPRSLMQGDYMTLRYSFGRGVRRDGHPATGRLVAEIDAGGVARFHHFGDPGPAGADQIWMRYAPSRRGRGGFRVAPESFLFEEGTAAVYEAARYASVRVDGRGEAVIVGLRDRDKRPLGAGG